MAVENQSAEMFANNRHLLQWAQILDQAGTASEDLTGRIVKFSLTRKDASGNPLLTPILDFASDDASPQVTIPTPNPVDDSGVHVQVELLPADTATLAPIASTFYFELEVFEGDGSAPVVVATGDLLIKPNVENA